jgi:hypothetical protein
MILAWIKLSALAMSHMVFCGYNATKKLASVRRQMREVLNANPLMREQTKDFLCALAGIPI